MASFGSLPNSRWFKSGPRNQKHLSVQSLPRTLQPSELTKRVVRNGSVPNASDDQVNQHYGINGHCISAPSSSEDAVIAAINVEGCLESGEFANPWQNSSANDLDGD